MPSGKNKMSKVSKASPNSNLRTGTIIIAVLIAIYFLVKYLNDKTTDSISIVSLSDRSESYKVKVIPSSLDDKSLHELPKETFSYLAMIDAGSSGCRAHVYRYGNK